MPNRVSVISGDTVKFVFDGDQNEANYMTVMQEAEALVSEELAKKQAMNVLVDVEKVGKVSLSVRQLAARNMGEWPLNHVAIFGANTYLRHLASLVIMATGNKRTRVFKTEKEASAWLKAKAN